MIIDCIQKICQLKPCKRWQIISRVKNFIKYKQLKKQCLNDIMSDNFIKLFPDICIGFHHIISGLGIKTSVVSVNHIYNNNTNYMIQYDALYVSEIGYNVEAIIWYDKGNEDDRIRVRLSPKTIYSGKSYDIYIYLDTQENYTLQKLKGSTMHSLVLHTVDVYSTLLDQVYKKYIGGDYNDKKKI